MEKICINKIRKFLTEVVKKIWNLEIYTQMYLYKYFQLKQTSFIVRGQFNFEYTYLIFRIKKYIKFDENIIILYNTLGIY